MDSNVPKKFVSIIKKSLKNKMSYIHYFKANELNKNMNSINKILEILLNDRKVTDIYLDAPIGGKPIYLVHSEYGQCQTNVTFTENEANSLISKLRAMSARPFDEAHPVLDFDLQDESLLWKY